MINLLYGSMKLLKKGSQAVIARSISDEAIPPCLK